MSSKQNDCSRSTCLSIGAFGHTEYCTVISGWEGHQPASWQWSKRHAKNNMHVYDRDMLELKLVGRSQKRLPVQCRSKIDLLVDRTRPCQRVPTGLNVLFLTEGVGSTFNLTCLVTAGCWWSEHRAMNQISWQPFQATDPPRSWPERQKMIASAARPENEALKRQEPLASTLVSFISLDLPHR